LCSAVNGGVPVAWTIVYNGATSTKNGQWWWTDQGPNYNDLFSGSGGFSYDGGSGSGGGGWGSSFSPDDGLWGAGSGVVNGDHHMPPDFWGVGNLNSGDRYASVVATCDVSVCVCVCE
jgi:hypothetical protein